MSDNIIVKDATGATRTMRSTDDGVTQRPHHLAEGVRVAYRENFSGSSLNSSRWDSAVGLNGAITVSGGNLTISTGPTALSESWVMSKQTFTLPIRMNVALSLSQRIANQTFFVELLSVDASGNPNGQHSIGFVFDGTTATQAKYRVQCDGNTALDSAASTFYTTASTSVFQLDAQTDEAVFSVVAIDSTLNAAYSYRRHQQLPDPNATYKLRIRSLNGSTTPASSTNLVVSFVSIKDYFELNTRVTGGTGTLNAGTAMPVNVTNTYSVYNADNAFYNDTVTALAANTTFTGTTHDCGATAGSTHKFSAFNAFAFADQAGVFRIECSNDNSTWRKATADQAVSANVPVILSIPVMTRYHRVVFGNGATAQTVLMVNSSYTAS